MAYLCVNKDGQELICQNEPARRGNIKRVTKSPYGTLDKTTGLRYEIREAKSYEKVKPEDLAYWKDGEDLGGGDYYIDYDIKLPQGSIEKLIGKTLTWEDEPVEI